MRVNNIAKVSILGSAVAAGSVAWLWRRAMKVEAGRLAAILGWRHGVSVADVGAGSGALAMAAARRVGRAGQVFATEIDPGKLARLRKKMSKRRLENVRIIEAADGRSGLSSGCCDAILLRGSYHHFTDSGAITADLYRAVRPGGLVAVVDFPPRRWLSLIAPVKGVPANRGGHGIAMDLLIQEMTSAGFELKETIAHWFLDVYCVVFRKPSTLAY